MTRIGRERLVGRWLLAVGLAGAAGCLQGFNPVTLPSAALVEPCKAVPTYARNHVNVFLANGVDPFGLGNLDGVREYIIALGFTHTYFGQIYHRHWLENELREARKHDPLAHFVLIGYGKGADTVRAVAQAVAKDRIPIDALITLQASTPGADAGTPGDACPLPAERALGAPTDPQTLQSLAEELMRVGGLVPLLPALPPPEVAPAPRRAPAADPETAPAPRRAPADPETAPAPRPVPPSEVSLRADEPAPLRPLGQLHTYDLPTGTYVGTKSKGVPARASPDDELIGDEDYDFPTPEVEEKKAPRDFLSFLLSRRAAAAKEGVEKK